MMQTKLFRLVPKTQVVNVRKTRFIRALFIGMGYLDRWVLGFCS